ncbi:MAG: hypothetical protein JWO05_1094 [Gemmatimonadetes bacterium]|nr:hypothetical protein [Gemmatimonadota bacterium]
MRSISRLAAALAFGCALVAPASVARAQYSANLIVPGLPSPWVSDWERNPQIATMVVTYTGTAPAEYNLQAEIRGATRGVITTATSGPYEIPLGPTTQVISSTQLNCFAADNVKSFVDQIVHTGQIPEDRYTLTVKLVDRSGKELTRASQSFTISLPDPPRLVFPSNGSAVIVGQPMFQWMPVTAPPELGLQYKFRLVEILPTQTPDVALAANRPLLEQLVSGASTMLYPTDGLPLEEGNKYAWRVEAVDAEGRNVTSARQRSEPWSFTRAPLDAGLPTGFMVPDTVTLVPGVAILTGMKRADSRSTADRVTMYGRARLEMIGPVKGSGDVYMDGVALDRSTLPKEANVIAGGLSGNMDRGIAVGKFVTLKGFNWSATSGMHMRAELTLPGGKSIPLDGNVEMTPSGPFGTLSAYNESPNGWPTLGTDPMQVHLTSARVSLPSGNVQLGGSVDLFGTRNSCPNVTMTADSSGVLAGTLSCATDRMVPLVAGSPTPTLGLIRVDGGFTIASNGTLTPAITAIAELLLDGSRGANCGGLVDLTMDNTGTRATRLAPRCEGDGSVKLGWLELALTGLKMDKLTYAAGRGFDFGFHVDAQPRVPSLEALRLPALAGVSLTPAGWAFANADGAASSEGLNVGGFTLNATQAKLGAFTRPWSSTDGGGFRFTISEGVSLAGLAGSSASCLAGAMPAVATLADGKLETAVTEHDLAANCSLDLGSTNSLTLGRLRGAMVATLLPSLQVQKGLEVQGVYQLPTYFDCAAGTRSMSLGSQWLALSGEGRVSGKATGLTTPCAINLAAVALSVTGGTLTLDSGTDGSATALLSGTASGNFTPGATPVAGSGTIGIDLVAGRMTSGSVTFNGPFALALPRKSPTLNFTVPGAQLDTAGLHIDGRGALALASGNNVGVTFDRLAINPLDFTVIGGQASFDNAFGLRVAIDTTGGALAWSAVQAGSAVGAAPELRMDLSSGATLGAEGLHSTGTAPAALNYRKLSFANASASYSDSLALRVAPFGVNGGSIDIVQQGERLAWIDAGGFHPDRLQSATAGLPKHIGLPNESVGFLDLAGSDSSAITTVRNPDGSVHITTRAGRTMLLGMPGLGATAPLNATVDVVVEVAGGSVTSGMVAARANLDIAKQGVPFVVDSLEFTGGGTNGWRVLGRPQLLGAARGAVGAAELALDATTSLTGQFGIAARASLPVAQGLRAITFALDSISGTIDNAKHSFDARGAFALAMGDGQSYRIPAILTESPTGLVVTEVGAANASAINPVSLGAVSVQFTAPRISRLSYGPTGWDYEFLFDAHVGFTSLGQVPPQDLSDLVLDKAGLHVASFGVPELNAQATTRRGFAVRPLALRSTGGVIDWVGGARADAWNLSVDVELSYPKAAGALANEHLSVLDAKMVNGVFTGPIEPLTLATPALVAFGTSGAALQVATLTGTLGDVPDVTVGGNLVLPTDMRCASNSTGVVALPSTGIKLSPDAWFNGTTSSLSLGGCPVSWGPMTMRMASGTLEIYGTATTQVAQLRGTATVGAPGMGSDTISSSGALVLNIGTVRPSSAITINGRMRWPYAPGSTIGLGVRTLVLGPTGVSFGSPGALRVGADSIASIELTGVSYAFPSLGTVSGSIGVREALALSGALAANGRVSWVLTAAGAPNATADQVTLQLSQNTRLDAQGLTTSATSGSRVLFDQRTLANLASTPSGDFHFSLTQLGVAQGRLDLFESTASHDSVGYFDANGFNPASQFATPRVPARLSLPSDDIAYVDLKDASGKPLVEVLRSGERLIVRALNGNKAKLVVPALSSEFGTAPSMDVALDVEVNARTWAVVKGSIEATAPAKTLSANVLELKRITYSGDSTGYALRAGGRIVLPASLPAVDLEVDGLPITKDGINGSLTRGNYSTTNSAADKALVTGKAGALDVSVIGVKATFAGSSREVLISGLVSSPLFTQAGANGAPAATVVFPYSGTVRQTANSFTLGAVPTGSLTIRESTLDPAPVGTNPAYRLVVSPTEFTLLVNGLWKVPKVAKEFAVTLSDLSIGTGGVKVLGLDQAQEFTAWGTKFTASAGGSSKSTMAVGTDGVLKLTMAGKIVFLGVTGQFKGLTIGSDATVIAADSTLLVAPLKIGTGAFMVNAVAVKAGILEAALAVKLPEPLVKKDAGALTTTLKIGADGTLSQKRLVVRDELIGLLGGTLTSITGFTIHTRNISINIPDATGVGGAVEVVADGYMSAKEANLLYLGTDKGGIVKPGYRLGFDGKESFQNFSMRDTIVVPVKKLAELQIQAITAPEGTTFEIGLTGRIALNATKTTPQGKPTDKGSRYASGAALLFRDLFIMDKGVDFSRFAVEGGTLALMNGALLIDVARFSYKDSPSTIKVMSSPPPPGKMPTGAGTEDLAVNYHINMGGRICVGKPGNSAVNVNAATCIFSGGIDQLLMYEEASNGNVTFSISNLNANVQKTFDMHLSMRYNEVAGGAGIAFAGNGTSVLGNEFIVAGAVEVGDNDFRIGAFLALPVAVQLGPVTITGVGGGFFWNPRPEHLQMVRDAAFPSNQTMAASAQLSYEPARFAIFLYGQAQIVNKKVAVGRALLMATDQQFRLDASVVVLDKPGTITGRAQLVIGLHKGYVEGTIDIIADQPLVVKSTGSLQFFAYSSSAWGIQGDAQMEFLPVPSGKSILTQSAQADFFIGPKGFVAGLRIEKSLSLYKIITLSGGFVGRVWFYDPAPSAWGAYAAVHAEVSVLFGAASASGQLEGALIGSGGSIPSLYCVGTLSVSVFWVGSWSGSVWAAAKSSGLSGGLGRDASLDAALAKAKQVRDEMETSKTQVMAAMNEAKVRSFDLKLSESEMLAVYTGLSALAKTSGFNFVSVLMFSEKLGFALGGGRNDYGYYDWYATFLRNEGAPVTDSAQVKTLKKNADDLWASSQRQQSDVEPKIRAINATLAQVAEVKLPDAPGNPVRNVSFASPVATTSVVNGDTVKTLISGPQLDIDQSTASQAVSSMEAHDGAMKALAAEVLRQAQAEDASLKQVQSALSASSGSLLSMMATYASARSATERLYTQQLQYLGAAKLWARVRLADLQRRKSDVADIQNQVIGIYQQRMNGDAMQKVFAMTLSPVTTGTLNRIKLMGSLTGNPQLEKDFGTALGASYGNNTSVAFLSAQYLKSGMTLYYNVPETGAKAQLAMLDSNIASVQQQAAAKLTPIRESHNKLTWAADAIFLNQASLAGLTYDLYDRYLALDPTGAGAAAATARKAELLRGMKMPTVNPVTIAVKTTGWVSEITASWSGYHPDGITEYLYWDNGGAPFSLGGTGTFVGLRSYLDTPISSLNNQYSFSAAVRGGLGYRNMVSASYSVSYPSGLEVQQQGAPTADVSNITKVSTTTTTVSSAGDKTPPNAPQITFNGAGRGPTGEQWIKPGSKVKANWFAYDNESGISEYQLAVGTTAQGTDISNWESMGGRTDRQLNDINISNGKMVFVSVKATNGNGIVSAIGSSGGLRIDAKPPVLGPIELVPVVAPPTPTTLANTVSSCYSQQQNNNGGGWGGNFNNNFNNNNNANFNYPTVTVKLPQVTDESGVQYWMWHLSNQPDTVVSNQWTNIYAPQMNGNTITIMGYPLSYTDPVYLMLAGSDYAGNVTVTQYGPFKVPDPTLPTSPGVCTTSSQQGELYVVMNSKAEDPESSISGYQVRITKDGKVVQDWPAAGTIQFTADNGSTKVYTAPTDGSFDVDVRAVNGAGMAGAAVRSGPIALDRTPPSAPTWTDKSEAPVDYVYEWQMDDYWYHPVQTDPGKIAGVLTFGADAQSGVDRTEVAMGFSPDDQGMMGWQNVTNMQNAHVTGNSADVVIYEQQPYGWNRDPNTEYYVFFRSVNKAGLTSATTMVRMKMPKAIKKKYSW